MRLELGTFPIKKVSFFQETRLDTELRIDRDELQQLVLADPRVAQVEIDLVEPGKSTRIIHVCDAIEPRIKITGPGTCYPGVLGPVETVGTGVTYRLSGLSVLISAEYPGSIGTGVGAVHEAVLDMSGPAALSPLSRAINLVLTLSLAPGFSQPEYHQGVRLAGFKVAHRLAQTTRGKTPPELQRYELGPGEGGLPKVVYVDQVLTQVNLPVPYLTWYGMPITDWMPFWVHPNEILDGALLPNSLGGYAAKPTSWEHVNNPIIEGLCKQHGRSLEFLGVILHRTRFETFEEKQLSANQAAKLAKLMGAQGAIITWIGAGNAFIEAMLTVQALEKEGIKAVLMTYEHGGKEGTEAPLIFSVPEADAMVSLGSLDRPVTLPPVEHVIGGRELRLNPETGSARIPAAQELRLDWSLPIVSAVDHWGFERRICVDY